MRWPLLSAVPFAFYLSPFALLGRVLGQRPRANGQRPYDRRIPIAFYLLPLALLFGCGGGGGGSSNTVSNSAITVAVSPTSATVPINKSQQFTATVTGGSGGATWSVNGIAGGNNSVGTIDQFGDYRATQIPSPSTVTITATSMADTSKSGNAMATVVFNAGTAAKQSPPIVLGTSGGNANDSQTSGNKVTCCGGTLGALVQRDNSLFILSANHVMARSNAAAVGDAIVQPGLDTNNCTAGQTVANLSQFADLKTSNVDAAIAAIVPGQVDTSGAILALGAVSNSTIASAPPSSTLAVPLAVMNANEGVAKVGSTTGLTCSTVTSINTAVKVDYSQVCGGATSFTTTFNNQIIIQGGSFSASGDSGSLVVTTDTARPVGLLFAGNTTTSTADPIQDVINALQNPNTHSFPAIVGAADHGVSCVANASGQVTKSQAQAATSTAQMPSEDLQNADAVRQRHLSELMANPAVAAVITTRSQDNSRQPGIEIHLSARAQQPVPQEFEGVRTRIVRDFAISDADLRKQAAELTAAFPQAVAAKEAHVSEMMSRTGIYAVGVGRSEDDNNSPAIVIYGERSALDGVPAFLEGVRTRVIEGDRYTTTWGKRQINACHRPK